MSVIANPADNSITIIHGRRRTLIDPTLLRNNPMRTQFRDDRFFQRVSISTAGARLVWPHGNEHRIADLAKGDFQRKAIGFAPVAG